MIVTAPENRYDCKIYKRNSKHSTLPMVQFVTTSRETKDCLLHVYEGVTVRIRISLSYNTLCDIAITYLGKWSTKWPDLFRTEELFPINVESHTI